MPRSLEEQREHDSLVARVIALEYHTGLMERPAPAPIAPVEVAPADGPDLAKLQSLLHALRSAGVDV